MNPVNKRSVGVCILLSIFTGGIYAIYWLYLLVKNVRALKDDSSSCTGEMLCLLFVPFYAFYWWYTRGNTVKRLLEEREYHISSTGSLYLVLSIIGLGIVAMAIMQSDFNSLPSAVTQSQQRGAKTLSTGKVWCFAIGQFGWSVLAALISSWLVNYYQPDMATQAAGQPIFIPQGLAILGVLTVLGAITAFGRIFDAVTDPMIASLSDRCKSKDGRRIPFMRAAAIPFALTCALTFWSPVGHESWLNAAFLFLMLMLFYLFMTMYCTPYNALIPELGADQKTRMAISTSISFTYIAGMAVAYVAPVVWGALQGAGLSRVTAIRVTFTAMAALGLICMFVPVFTIREKDYVTAAPSESTALRSLGATFRNRDFRVFVASDIAYFLGITMFQTALPFFVTSLLKLDESMSTVYFVLMTALSVLFYVPINKLTPKFGKKKLILFAFCVFTLSFLYTAAFGSGLPIPPAVQGYILCAVAAPAMAIFGILPQAVVADIAECDALETHENRSGMFYAARTFAFKLGQSIAMLLVTAFATIGQAAGTGYRITAVAAAAVCVLGGVLFLLYDEKKVYGKIMK